VITVIIPAHNEAAVIERGLSTLLADARPDEFGVLVACNGCTDDTAERARKIGNVRSEVHVMEIPAASKIEALNQALTESAPGPVIVLDADVQLPTRGVRQLQGALAQAGVLAATTGVHIDMTGANRFSRSYHRYWAKLPSIRAGLAGRGVYGLSEAGRTRLGVFPDVVADDRYVHQLFPPAQRCIVSQHSTVAATRSLRELIYRKTRVFAGNDEIADGFASEADGSWTDVLREDATNWRDLPVYLGVNAIAKTLARTRRGSTPSWNRDESTRVTP